MFLQNTCPPFKTHKGNVSRNKWLTSMKSFLPLLIISSSSSAVFALSLSWMFSHLLLGMTIHSRYVLGDRHCKSTGLIQWGFWAAPIVACNELQPGTPGGLERYACHSRNTALASSLCTTWFPIFSSHSRSCWKAQAHFFVRSGPHCVKEVGDKSF